MEERVDFEKLLGTSEAGDEKAMERRVHKPSCESDALHLVASRPAVVRRVEACYRYGDLPNILRSLQATSRGAGGGGSALGDDGAGGLER